MRTRSGTLVPEGLIATKLHPPEFDSRFISRRALFEDFLGTGIRRSIMTVVATPGSGKSVLLAELHRALAEAGATTCWLSLDADDNNAAAFASYFLSALRPADPALVARELALLRSNPVQDFAALLDKLLRRLSAVTTELAIFLDDFQHITDAQVLSFVNRLALYLPPSVRLIIASRTRFLLDLGRLRVSGHLTEIEQDALDFDSAQAADFLHRLHGLELRQSDLNALLTTTEGWPTGLQLAALALRKHRGPARELIDSFCGRDTDLISYLVESVLRSQPAAVRNFLLKTAPLRRMSAELCQAVSDQPDSGAMLGHIERCNLFLIPLDRQGHWYRYHHLFAEFLVNELHRTSPGEFQAVCAKAAQWCKSKGLTTEAIQYSLDAPDFEKASDLIAEHAPIASQWHGDHYSVLDWMRRLPLQYHARRPEILLALAWAQVFSRGCTQAMEISEQVLDRLRDDLDQRWTLGDEERNRLRLQARVTLALAEIGADRLESGVARSLELRAQIPESEPFLMSTICNCLSYCHFARREFERSASDAADAHLYGHRAGNDYTTSWADFLHGLSYVELGRLRTAQEHGRRILDGAQRSGSPHGYLAALAALLNAEIATQRCEFEQTRLHMEVGKSFTDVFGPLEPLLLAIRNQARQQAWEGNSEDARRVLMQGQDLALSLDQPRLFLTLAIEETILQLNAGDLAGALETAQRARLQDSRHQKSGPSVRDALQLLQARLLIEGGKAPAALRVLSQAHATSADKGGSFGLQLKAVKAIALWQSQRRAEAVRELDRALSAATGEFHAYPLVSAGPALLPVLRAIGERRSEPAASDELQAKNRLQRWLVARLSGEKPEREPAHPKAVGSDAGSEALTERESELLSLVEAGLGNRQLADTLLISEATVKWHLHNIYSKIGVRNRMAATARARELRLI